MAPVTRFGCWRRAACILLLAVMPTSVGALSADATAALMLQAAVMATQPDFVGPPEGARLLRQSDDGTTSTVPPPSLGSDASTDIAAYMTAFVDATATYVAPVVKGLTTPSAWGPLARTCQRKGSEWVAHKRHNYTLDWCRANAKCPLADYSAMSVEARVNRYNQRAAVVTRLEGTPRLPSDADCLHEPETCLAACTGMNPSTTAEGLVLKSEVREYIAKTRSLYVHHRFATQRPHARDCGTTPELCDCDFAPERCTIVPAFPWTPSTSAEALVMKSEVRQYVTETRAAYVKFRYATQRPHARDCGTTPELCDCDFAPERCTVVPAFPWHPVSSAEALVLKAEVRHYIADTLTRYRNHRFALQRPHARDCGTTPELCNCDFTPERCTIVPAFPWAPSTSAEALVLKAEVRSYVTETRAAYVNHRFALQRPHARDCGTMPELCDCDLAPERCPIVPAFPWTPSTSAEALLLKSEVREYIAKTRSLYIHHRFATQRPHARDCGTTPELCDCDFGPERCQLAPAPVWGAASAAEFVALAEARVYIAELSAEMQRSRERNGAGMWHYDRTSPPDCCDGSGVFRDGCSSRLCQALLYFAIEVETCSHKNIIADTTFNVQISACVICGACVLNDAASNYMTIARGFRDLVVLAVTPLWAFYDTFVLLGRDAVAYVIRLAASASSLPESLLLAVLIYVMVKPRVCEAFRRLRCMRAVAKDGPVTLRLRGCAPCCGSGGALFGWRADEILLLLRALGVAAPPLALAPSVDGTAWLLRLRSRAAADALVRSVGAAAGAAPCFFGALAADLLSTDVKEGAPTEVALLRGVPLRRRGGSWFWCSGGGGDGSSGSGGDECDALRVTEFLARAGVHVSAVARYTEDGGGWLVAVPAGSYALGAVFNLISQVYCFARQDVSRYAVSIRELVDADGALLPLVAVPAAAAAAAVVAPNTPASVRVDTDDAIGRAGDAEGDAPAAAGGEGRNVNVDVDIGVAGGGVREVERATRRFIATATQSTTSLSVEALPQCGLRNGPLRRLLLVLVQPEAPSGRRSTALPQHNTTLRRLPCNHDKSWRLRRSAMVPTCRRTVGARQRTTPRPVGTLCFGA
ncbi:hypothetical protein JKP88DRAFT_249094 [Tribonema minus]|uniref:Uncharacterized protein n=1 Tax=Tribonema minus TaxID=303371 RepID=A0A835YNH9_9STRA|nr:hypothetical protein JKP88DRAFT_249094 [Tribonema minus]